MPQLTKRPVLVSVCLQQSLGENIPGKNYHIPRRGSLKYRSEAAYSFLLLPGLPGGLMSRWPQLLCTAMALWHPQMAGHPGASAPTQLDWP